MLPQPDTILGGRNTRDRKDDGLYITDTEELAAFCERARASRLVALDTEFMREKTYFAKLCLIQACAADESVIIDPLTIADLSPLMALLADTSVLKVVHAGSQDMEIFYRLANVAIAPIFDTQIAATLAGFPSQVGYARLVKELYDVDIDKSDTFTDWARRPLTAAQIKYALADVTYLPGMYETLRDRLEKDGRLQWVERDFERMSDPATYEVVPEQQFRRIKRASSLSKRQLGVLQQVTAWREREAQRRDLPKRWIVSDETLLEVARRQPADASAMADIRGMSPRALGAGGAGLLAAVAAGLALTDEQLPKIPKRPRNIIDIEGIVELMSALVRVRAAESGVAVPLLASRGDLERLAGGDREDNPLLGGWRRALIGEELVALIDGRLTLRVADGKVLVEAARD
jgi:ribonuclease D